MKGRTQTSAVACDHPYNLFVRAFLFTVLAHAALRCGLKKQEILVRTVGGITGMMDHLIKWNFLSLCARKQALNSSPHNVHVSSFLITLLQFSACTICTNNCTNISVAANGTHRLSSGKIMVKGIQTQDTF